MKKLIYLFVITFFSSCAFHSGTLTGIYTDIGTPYKINGKATGYAKANYFLGIGGLAKKQLVEDAKEDMYLNSPLGANQVYANVSVNFKNSFFIVYNKTEVFITADIISKMDENESYNYLKTIADDYNKEIVSELRKGNISGVKLNESVYSFVPATRVSRNVVVVEDNKDSFVVSSLVDKETKPYTLKKSEIYRYEYLKELQTLIGREIMFPNSELKAVIIAINPYSKDLLVKTEGKKIKKVTLLK